MNEEMTDAEWEEFARWSAMGTLADYIDREGVCEVLKDLVDHVNSPRECHIILKFLDHYYAYEKKILRTPYDRGQYDELHQDTLAL